MLDAGVSLRDVQIAARHADPRTTMRCDRARKTCGRARPNTSTDRITQQRRDKHLLPGRQPLRRSSVWRDDERCQRVRVDYLTDIYDNRGYVAEGGKD
jgi:hypothetical protein